MFANDCVPPDLAGSEPTSKVSYGALPAVRAR